MKRIGFFLLLFAITIVIMGCNLTTDSSVQTTLSTAGTSDSTFTTVSVSSDTSDSTISSTNASTIIPSSTISSSTTDTTVITTDPELLVDEMAYLHSEGQQWYEFILTESGYITAYTVSTVDTDGMLCTADYLLINTDEDSGIDTNFLIRNYLEAGTYYIAVSGAEGYYEGDYRIIVEYLAESTIDFLSSSEAYLESGETTRYEVSVTESGYLVALTLGFLDTCGDLYSSDETDLMSDDDGGYDFNFLIYYYVTPGTYYIDAYGYDSEAVGNYQFISFLIPGDNTDHFYAVDTYLIASAYDSYPITITEDGYLSAYTLGDLDTYGYLYTSDNTLIVDDDDSGVERNCQVSSFVTAGSYYVVVTGYDNSEEGDYRFVVDFEPANDYPHLLCDEGYIENGDNHWYDITITESGYLTVFTVGDEVDTFGYLYDSWHDELLHNDDGGSNYNFLLFYHVTPDTYYICVTGYDNTESGNYQVIIDFTPDGESNFSYFFSAYGDTSLSSTSQFEFTLAEPGVLTIYTISSLDTYGYLYSSEDVLLRVDDDSYEDCNFIIVYNAEAGTYYVEVEGLDTDLFGPYLLIVNFQPYN